MTTYLAHIFRYSGRYPPDNAAPSANFSAAGAPICARICAHICADISARYFTRSPQTQCPRGIQECRPKNVDISPKYLPICRPISTEICADLTQYLPRYLRNISPICADICRKSRRNKSEFLPHFLRFSFGLREVLLYSAVRNKAKHKAITTLPTAPQLRRQQRELRRQLRGALPSKPPQDPPTPTPASTPPPSWAFAPRKAHPTTR